MRKKLPYQVILPDSYQNSVQSYPVLYLLHGLFGSYRNWLELTGIKFYAKNTNFIIVLPEAGNSWYTDSQTNESERFESFFINEFVPGIENKFRILQRKEARAICGLSMGGYGALKFALKRPDLFNFSGSMSGAFDAPRQHEKNHGVDWENMGQSISSVFGTEESITRQQNDLFILIDRLNENEIKSLPNLYLNCGGKDDFLTINRELVHQLKRKKIKFQYYEKPGGHDWEYWDKELKELLSIIENKFSSVDRNNQLK